MIECPKLFAGLCLRPCLELARRWRSQSALRSFQRFAVPVCRATIKVRLSARLTRYTLIAVVEVSQSSWLVAAIVPGVSRQPLKKHAADEKSLLKLLFRWRDKAAKGGHQIARIAVACEAGRDGFWLCAPRARTISEGGSHLDNC